MRSLAAVLALLVIAVASHAGAQSAAGGIRGRVTTDAERPVARMTVTAVRPDGSFLRRATTDAAGMFQVGALPPGTYDVTVQLVGYRRTVVRGVEVSAGQTTEITIAVAATAVELAPVVVDAASVTIERGRPEFDTRLDERMITHLPVGTDVQRLVGLTPGVRADQLWGGSSTQANNYQLNGIAANHPGLGGAMLAPNVSWIEQVEVRGLGAAAEHGNFQGGIVNVVTKTGSNTRQGMVRTAMEAHRLNGSNLTTTEDVPELASRNEVEAEGRGPIVRDRLFYYLSGQAIRSDRRAVNHLRIGDSRFAPMFERTDELRALLRLTANPTTADLLNASAGYTGTFTDNFGLTGRETSEATQRRRAPTAFADLSWERRMGRVGSVEAKVAHLRATDTRASARGRSVPGIATFHRATGRRYQNAVFDEVRRPVSSSGSLVWRALAMTGPVEHQLTLGGEDAVGRWKHRRTRNGGMTWRPRYYARTVDRAFDAADPSTWPAMIPTAWGGEIDVDARVRNTAAFVQDDMTWGRLTVTPGVRLGWWGGRIRDTAGTMIPAVNTRGIDGRLGLVLDLSGLSLRPRRARAGASPTAPRSEPTFVLKVHAGRYHQGMFAQLFDRLAGTASYSDAELWEYSGAAPSDPATTYTREQRDALAVAGGFRLLEHVELHQTGRVENLRQPYVDQLVAGLEKTVGRRVKVGALWIRRDNHDIVALVDRNAATNWTPFDDVALYSRYSALEPRVNEPLYDHDGQPLRLERLYIRNDAIAASLREYVRLRAIDPTSAAAYAVPGFTPADTTWLTYAPDYVLTSDTEARRKYDQYQANASAVFGRFTAAGSVAHTNLRGNFFSVSGYDAATVSGRDRLEGGGPGPFVRPNEAINYWGKLENYSTLELKLLATADLPGRFRAGMSWYRASGDRLTPSLTLSRHGIRYVTAAGELDQPVLGSIDGHRVFTTPRGGYKYKSRQTLDLRVARAVDIAGRELELAAEGFNVLGASDVTLVNTYLEAQVDPGFDVRFFDPLRRVEPRRLRLTAAARF